MTDMARELRGKCLSLLGMLGDGRWHTQQECAASGGMRYSARILELRRRGHDIETRQVDGRQFVYRLAPRGTLFD
jgi:hypothetical protein